MKPIEVEWQTFDEWKEEGYFVAKGERSKKRHKWTGEPLFHISQVEPRYSDEDVGGFNYDSKCEW